MDNFLIDFEIINLISLILVHEMSNQIKVLNSISDVKLTDSVNRMNIKACRIEKKYLKYTLGIQNFEDCHNVCFSENIVTLLLRVFESILKYIKT